MDKVKLETPDLTQENVEKIAALFPDVVTETVGDDGEVRRAIDFDASLADDATAANFEEFFRTYSPDTVRRVI